MDKQVAIVTGASRGIGFGIMLRLAEQGMTVIGTATSELGQKKITQALQEKGLSGRGIVLNVNDAQALNACVDEVVKEFGQISVLVNNAGITQDQLAMRMKDEDWDAVIQTNLTAVFRLSRAVLRPMLKARYGRIINITSVVGSAGNAGQVNYAAAKAGVAGMARSLAKEVGSRDITVNCIAPGFIDTAMTQVLSEEQRLALQSQIPIGRLGNVDDIAHAVVFLASQQAGYITGATLHVNGGMYMSN